MDSFLHQYDNSIILVARDPIEGRRVIGPFSREHNVDPESLYNESEEYNKEILTGKLIYRVIDENGRPFKRRWFKKGKVQIYNVDTKEYQYFDSKDHFYDNYDFLGKKMIEWRPHTIVLPIVNLTTYLYFRPLVNYDCNFMYKGDWYILAGKDARNVDYRPNYSVLVNEIEEPPRPEDIFHTPLELLENYVMLDGTRLWDIKEETVFKWYRTVFTENDANDFYCL